MEKNNEGKHSGFFSKKLKAGKKRTYFFDVRNTKQGDYFLTITESKKKFDGEGYDSHKIFLYKEDFKKFVEALEETVNYVKKELMPDFDYDAERPVRSDDNQSERPARSENQAPKEKSFILPKENKPKSIIDKEDTENTTSNVTPPITDDEEIDWNW